MIAFVPQIKYKFNEELSIKIFLFLDRKFLTSHQSMRFVFICVSLIGCFATTFTFSENRKCPIRCKFIINYNAKNGLTT